MTQVKDFPDRTDPEPTDFAYLVTDGNTDFKVRLKTLLGELTKEIIDPFYELVLADQYHTIRMSFPGNKELTVPTTANVPFIEGTVIRVRNASENLVTLIPETIAVELKTKGGLNIVPHGEVKLVYFKNDEWDVIGDLTT